MSHHGPLSNATPFQRPSAEAEAESVRRLRNDEGEALGPILDLYWTILVRFADRILEDPDGSEDVVQEAYVRVWDRRKHWERRDTLRPILFRTVRNLALNEKRRRDTFRRWAHTLRRPKRDPSPSPLQEAEGTDMRTLVQEAVDGLPDRRREIFLLVRFQQLSYRETADTLDIQPQVVANQMSRAMKDLRNALSPHIEE